MFAPNLHRVGKRQSRRFFVWTGGFAVIAGIHNDDHRKACLGTAELHRTYCLVSLARHSGGSKKDEPPQVPKDSEHQAENGRSILTDYLALD